MRIIDADHLRRFILTRVFENQLSVADVVELIDREDTIEDLSDVIDQAIERLIRLTGCKTNEEITALMDASVTDSEGWLGGVAACIDELEDMQGEWEAK